MKSPVNDAVPVFATDADTVTLCPCIIGLGFVVIVLLRATDAVGVSVKTATNARSADNVNW